MKVEALLPTRLRRGDEVRIGNVYTNPHGRPHYKIVIGIMQRDKFSKPWNNVAFYKVFVDGSCAGAAVEPMEYIRDHQDLVGIIKEMPTMQIEWLQNPTCTPPKDKNNAKDNDG
jgi:hypothetical protein